MAEPESNLHQLMQSLRIMPGVGLRTSQRMALHLLAEHNREKAKQLAQSLMNALDQVGHCKLCRMLTEFPVCVYCQPGRKQPEQICVVENHGDVLALEQASYRGHYFVLQGYLSPLDGVTPKDLGIDLLLSRVCNGGFREVILATNLTVEGETTAHYIKEQLTNFDVKISRIAHGVPMGGELEYMSGSTLGLALLDRRDYSH